jgi:hypothetical protein
MAPPEIAIIKSADPVLVNSSKPSKVKGQIAGHTNVFAVPKAAANKTEIYPVVFRMQQLKMIPKMALAIKAVFCCAYFEIKKTPTA